ncbi:collagen-like protein [Neiella marina]|uniref:Collagen-like protein n=1 Tax=Neiella holothuriorum TaxID=2870530 RepID=A0ABS7EKM9_9GAMM|nr:choice-of-anchor I family protein [Neiella holothuriorum]MBW8192865.1 collagen-like protein [Neiella holothuriorum]
MKLNKNLILLGILSSLALVGCDGDDGKDGKDGINGVDGIAGLDGTDGQNGTDGQDGPDGQDGADGADGQDGLNGTLGLNLSPVGRIVLNADGAAEILQYHAQTQTIYAINSSDDTVEMIDLSAIDSTTLANAASAENLTATSLELPSEAASVELGGANSIAVYDDLMAVAIEADDQANNGYIVFYNGLNAGAPTFVSAVEVGNLPDMVTFTPDGTKVLVANEGEPSGDYSNDPEGSIAVIEITNGTPATTATIIDFTAFNGMQADLEDMGMHFPNPSGRTINGTVITTTVAQDLEPEYITTTNDTAYVSLQENNGLVVVDLSDYSVELIGLGFKDWSGLDFDGNEDGSVSFGQYEGLYGVYMPDSIASFSWNGASFIVTANEGDAREYFFDVADEAACTAAGGQDYDEDDGCLAFTDEVKLKDLSAEPGSLLEALQAEDEIGSLRVTSALGDADGNGSYDAAYSYGARSFTIWDQNGLVVFDSGDDMERITASIYGDAFNNTDDENAGDDRSENKGPEPEALTVGSLADRTYAFVGLERMGGVMVYDVTNPYNTFFVNYVNNRDVTEGLENGDGIGDLAPESLVFVSDSTSPTGNALLLVGNEVSGSVTVWEISAN